MIRFDTKQGAKGQWRWGVWDETVETYVVNEETGETAEGPKARHVAGSTIRGFDTEQEALDDAEAFVRAIISSNYAIYDSRGDRSI